MVYPFVFNSQEDIMRLSELASQEDFPIYISTPYGQLDARSIMGLFTMMGSQVNLVAPDSTDSAKFWKFIDKLQ